MGNPEPDKGKSLNQELYPRVWPPGHSLASETRPKSHFRDLLDSVEGALLPYLHTLLPVGFLPINTQFSETTKMIKQR